MNADARVRVALVCTELGVGGAERCVARVATGLNPGKFQARVIVLAKRPSDDRDALVQVIEDAGIPIEFLGLQSSLHVFRARRQLRRSLENHRPEVIQSFLFHANVLTLTTSPRGIPVSTGIRVADPRRWRHRVERWASRRASRIVCVSDSVRHFCEHTARLPADKLCVIPNGISLDRLPVDASSNESVGLPEGRRILLCVGRLHHQKGYDWLLPHWKDWSTDLPDHDLLIAGDGPDRDALERQIQTLGISDRVKLLGQRSDVAALISASDMLLLPSRWEGMPNVVLEAMASGKAVVAAHAEGVVELLGSALVEHQTAEFGDSQQWRERILALANDRRLAATTGEKNRQRVVEHFQVERMVGAYEQLFESLRNAARL